MPADGLLLSSVGTNMCDDGLNGIVQSRPSHVVATALQCLLVLALPCKVACNRHSVFEHLFRAAAGSCTLS